MSAPAPRLMTLRNAASMFGVSRDWLLTAVKEGHLDALQPAQAFLVDPDDVLNLIRARTAEKDTA